MIQQLAIDSLGAGIGVFLGVLIGLGIRRRKGKTEGLLGGSVLLTASAAAGLAMLVMMMLKYVTAV
ncbi:hypothetical protein [Salipiger bermudensis]|uniref:hypothetical protein n=1 Tax=Salipiger bermudensis TaxID=344736 RepID=UPI001CD67EFF|nr:hypothetical protein [Salipiger bermudensis]MCA0960640.1 hypothetical protein [Salipiger bermudensis]